MAPVRETRYEGRGVLGEVVVVSMDLDAQRAQSVGNDVSSE